jgi:hypothetical protein
MMMTINLMAEPTDGIDGQVLIIHVESLKGEVVVLNGASAFHSLIQGLPFVKVVFRHPIAPK